MKTLLLGLFFLPFICSSQMHIKIRISYQTSQTNQNTVSIDSTLFAWGFGQGPDLKIHLLMFDSDCENVDSLELGEYSKFKAYHYRQNSAADMVQLDSTLKYRIPDGTQYFLYTPCQYRKDFVYAAYSPMLHTLDSLCGPQVGHASTAFIFYGIMGDPSAREATIAYVSGAVYSMTKILCQNAGVNDLNIDQSDAVLYPNPASDLVKIEFKDARAREILIYNCMGKQVLVLTSEKDSYQLNVSTFDSGHYTVRILDNAGVNVEHLIVK